MKLVRKQGGFAYIAAVVLLVVVAGVIAASLRLTSAQQTTANDALLIARAGQAARAGIEWTMYQIRANGAAAQCPQTGGVLPGGGVSVGTAAKTDLVFTQAATGFVVTVKCGFVAYREGVDPVAETTITKNFYTIDALACNGTGTSCPGTAGAPDYTERRRVATICMLPGGGDCY